MDSEKSNPVAGTESEIVRKVPIQAVESTAAPKIEELLELLGERRCHTPKNRIPSTSLILNFWLVIALAIAGWMVIRARADKERLWESHFRPMLLSLEAFPSQNLFHSEEQRSILKEVVTWREQTKTIRPDTEALALARAWIVLGERDPATAYYNQLAESPDHDLKLIAHAELTGLDDVEEGAKLLSEVILGPRPPAEKQAALSSSKPVLSVQHRLEIRQMAIQGAQIMIGCGANPHHFPCIVPITVSRCGFSAPEFAPADVDPPKTEFAPAPKDEAPAPMEAPAAAAPRVGAR